MNHHVRFNEAVQKSMTETNEIRFVQNDQIFAARRTTTIEESVLQVSTPHLSQIPKRSFCHNAHHSRLQTTRRLMRIQCKTQPSGVCTIASSDEVVTLD